MDPFEAVLMAAQGVGRFFRIVDILYHHRRAGKADLSLLAVRYLLLGTRFYDLIESVRERQSDAALLVPVDRCKAAGSNALCSAVAFPYRYAGVVILQELVKTLLSSMDRESPPLNTPLRHDRSTLSRLFILSSASYRVGTPAIKFGLCF